MARRLGLQLTANSGDNFLIDFQSGQLSDIYHHGVMSTTKKVIFVPSVSTLYHELGLLWFYCLIVVKEADKPFELKPFPLITSKTLHASWRMKTRPGSIKTICVFLLIFRAVQADQGTNERQDDAGACLSKSMLRHWPRFDADEQRRRRFLGS